MDFLDKKKPLVSVVISSYNHAAFIQDSIKSIIDQNYKNIELIIIDDGSQDDSIEKINKMIASCQKRFIRFEFRSRSNKGLSATLNEALDWCQGKYFSPFASDDVMFPSKTLDQVDIMEKYENISVMCGGVEIIDCNNKYLKTWCTSERIYNFNDILLHQHELPACTALIRKNAIKSVGGYAENIVIEDWYMWLKLSRQANIMFVNKVFCAYRKHDSNTSNNLVLMHLERLKILKDYQDESNYRKAILNIQWIHAAEYLRVNQFISLLLYLKILISAPVFFIKQFYNRMENRLKWR